MKVNAEAFLEKQDDNVVELEAAIHTALLTLEEGLEGRISCPSIEVAVIGNDRKFRLLTPQSHSCRLSYGSLHECRPFQRGGRGVRRNYHIPKTWDGVGWQRKGWCPQMDQQSL